MIGRFFKPRLVASFSSGTALDYLRIRSGTNDDEAIARQWMRAGFHVTNHPHMQGRHQVIVGAVTLDLLPRDDSDDTDYRGGLVDRLQFQNLPSNAQTINNSILVSRSSRNRNKFESSKHINGITRVDHIVIKTSELDKVEQSISNELQMPLRRRGEMKGKRMLWYRNAMLPDTPIIEVVECEPTQKSGKSCTFVWGISFVTNVLEIMRDTIGHEYVSEIRPAKQPGRNICTLKNIELGIKVAVMTPHSTVNAAASKN
jgi:hypothetical protein